MARKRRTFSDKFKAKVTIEAVRGMKTLAELAPEYQVHPNQISDWKKQLLTPAPELFSAGKKRPAPTGEEITAPLYEEIGRLKTDLKWLEKSAERAACDRLLQRKHSLESSRFGGRSLRYVAGLDGQWVARLTFSAPALYLRSRERWIGWPPPAGSSPSSSTATAPPPQNQMNQPCVIRRIGQSRLGSPSASG